jgi:hypothetical protein
MTSPMVWLATALAALAIAVQPHNPPASFERGMERRGIPIVSSTFVGMEWRCSRPYQDETCYAGLDDAGRLVTGP